MPQLHAEPLADAGPKPAPTVGGPFMRFALAALAGLAGVAGLTSGLAGPDSAALALACGGYVAGALLALALLRDGYPHARLGLCNLVTLVRLALAAALLAPLAGVVAPWAIFAVAATAFALDGVDGWLARREGRVSAFGAQFDMEVDSALALILALNAWSAGTASALVLMIGLPRYLFGAAAYVWPWIAAPLPPRFSRKLVCVLQIGTLIALQLPPLTSEIADPLILVVSLALLWSFGRDIRWLWRRRV